MVQDAQAGLAPVLVIPPTHPTDSPPRVRWPQTLTIIYVKDVAVALTFFERAFGLSRHFVHESCYGELCTGDTTLAFATHALGAKNLPEGYVAADTSALPLGMEIALVTGDVAATHAKAVSEGAVELMPPTQKPWGQTVSYVRSPDGILIELCTPVTT